MQNIKITWQGDEIVLPLAEAEGFAESLEEAGESFEWEDLTPPATPATPAAPAPAAGIPWTGEGRDRNDYVVATEADLAAARAAAVKERQDELAAAAKEQNVPEWVIEARKAVSKGAAINRRADGSLWYSDPFTRRLVNLPWAAANYF